MCLCLIFLLVQLSKAHQSAQNLNIDILYVYVMRTWIFCLATYVHTHGPAQMFKLYTLRQFKPVRVSHHMPYSCHAMSWHLSVLLKVEATTMLHPHRNCSMKLCCRSVCLKNPMDAWHLPMPWNSYPFLGGWVESPQTFTTPCTASRKKTWNIWNQETYAHTHTHCCCCLSWPGEGRQLHVCLFHHSEKPSQPSPMAIPHGHKRYQPSPPQKMTGSWFGTFFIFPYIGFLIIPIDFHIFQRGSNHQPDINGLNSLLDDPRLWDCQIPMVFGSLRLVHTKCRIETIFNPNWFCLTAHQIINHNSQHENAQHSTPNQILPFEPNATQWNQFNLAATNPMEKKM